MLALSQGLSSGIRFLVVSTIHDVRLTLSGRQIRRLEADSTGPGLSTNKLHFSVCRQSGDPGVHQDLRNDASFSYDRVWLIGCLE